MAHHALPVRRGLETGMLCKKPSTSTAWVSSERVPLRRIREAIGEGPWPASWMTLLPDTAYHSLVGEADWLEKPNTTTIRRLTPSGRHQLPAMARSNLT